ncbi:MAG: hypothetical protein WA199_10865, partial [Xanthobacteraceae bacterium]
MVQPRHCFVLLLAACLAGCGSYAMVDPSAAFTSPAKQADWMKSGGQAPVAQTADYETADTASVSNRADTSTQSSLFTQAAETKLAAAPALAVAPAAKPIAVADAGEVPVAPAPQPIEKITQPRGRAYLFRGVAGLIYSRGIDTLATRIRRTGIPASVGTYL